MRKVSIIICTLLIFLGGAYFIFKPKTPEEMYKIALEERDYFFQEEAIDSLLFKGPNISYTPSNEATYSWHYKNEDTVAIFITVSKRVNLAHATTTTVQGSQDEWKNIIGSAYDKR